MANRVDLDSFSTKIYDFRSFLNTLSDQKIEVGKPIQTLNSDLERFKDIVTEKVTPKTKNEKLELKTKIFAGLTWLKSLFPENEYNDKFSAIEKTLTEAEKISGKNKIISSNLKGDPTTINLLKSKHIENIESKKELFNQIISGKLTGNIQEKWNEVFNGDGIIVGYKDKEEKVKYEEVFSADGLKNLLNTNNIGNKKYKRILGFSMGGQFYISENWGIHPFRKLIDLSKENILKWTGFLAVTSFAKVVYDALSSAKPILLPVIAITVAIVGVSLLIIGLVIGIDETSRYFAQQYYYNTIFQQLTPEGEDWSELKKEALKEE